MLLAVDVGNSNIVISCWNDGNWSDSLRLETHPILDESAYYSQLKNWLGDLPFTADISSVALSSVVPKVTELLAPTLTKLFSVEPLVLTSKTETGIALGADRPERVGADLIADAAGAYGIVNDTCIVVDFGTATTVMAVEKPGILRGGSICAGLKASVEALVGKTAQLQDIPLQIPESPIGKNTIECMKSGLVLGHLCMVEGLVSRIKKELGPSKVVATGGLVSLLAPHTDCFDFVEPMLTLDGLRRIAERHAKR